MREMVGVNQQSWNHQQSICCQSLVAPKEISQFKTKRNSHQFPNFYFFVIVPPERSSVFLDVSWRSVVNILSDCHRAVPQRLASLRDLGVF